MDIVEAVINNLKDKSRSEIEDAISDAVNTKNENALPGLGVLLLSTWQNSDNSGRENLLNLIMKGLQ